MGGAGGPLWKNLGNFLNFAIFEQKIDPNSTKKCFRVLKYFDMLFVSKNDIFTPIFNAKCRGTPDFDEKYHLLSATTSNPYSD